mmetsp:Transcript_22899/g.26300  ORF Transcript_22899/g.26300 Transcript_22899/m.26300 type:complete len:93 (-) Transcript_22899:110-388(-)
MLVRAGPKTQGAFEGHSKLHDDCCCASTVFLVDDDATERMRTRRELERMVTNIFVVVDDGVTDGVADGKVDDVEDGVMTLVLTLVLALVLVF